jgi:hypothetical protein
MSGNHRRQRCTPADIDGQRQDIQDNLRSLRVGQLAAVNLRLPVDARFGDQLAAMAAARGLGASASSRTQARRGENPGDALYSSWC